MTLCVFQIAAGRMPITVASEQNWRWTKVAHREQDWSLRHNRHIRHKLKCAKYRAGWIGAWRVEPKVLDGGPMGGKPEIRPLNPLHVLSLTVGSFGASSDSQFSSLCIVQRMFECWNSVSIPSCFGKRSLEPWSLELGDWVLWGWRV